VFGQGALQCCTDGFHVHKVLGKDMDRSPVGLGKVLCRNARGCTERFVRHHGWNQIRHQPRVAPSALSSLRGHHAAWAIVSGR
jgi:hypothetical protein